MQPLAAHGVERSSEVEAAEQLEECLALDRLSLRHVERHRGVLDPLACGESHALLAERERHAEELEILGRGLLLARVDAELVHGRFEHLKVHRRPPHVHAVTHQGLAVDVEHEVVDRDEAGVVDVHAEGEESRPALGDLVVRVSQLLGAPRPALEPREDALVSSRVSPVEGTKGLARSVHEQVRHPRALRRVRGAAETAALVDDEAVGCDRAVAVELARLPSELLVVGNGVERRRFYRRAGGL